MRFVPWWGVLSSAAAPLLLVGGWTVAASLQPRPFNAVARSISSLAAHGATDRWVMTFALAGVGACYILTGLALRPAALPGRLVLLVGGIATVLVAANPEPASGGSVPHFFWACLGFVAMATWPLAAWIRQPSDLAVLRPMVLRPAVSACAVAVMVGLFIWFGAELLAGGRQVGLAERLLAGTQAAWPCAVVLACRLCQRPAIPTVTPYGS